jgi:hypothetical protein
MFKGMFERFKETKSTPPPVPTRRAPSHPLHGGNRYDSEHERTLAASDFDNIVHQTADLRYRPIWESVRQLLAARGYSATETVLCSCDHAGGNDMAFTVALRDGKIVNCVVRSFPPSRDYTAVIEWNVLPDDPMDLARAAATNPVMIDSFNRAIAAYRDFFAEFYKITGANVPNV